MDKDKTVEAMEADVRAMASKLRPPMPRTDDKVTVTHLQQALDKLHDELAQVADDGWQLLLKVQGGERPGPPRGRAPTEGPVFEVLAKQITDCASQLASLKRAHEALGRALA
jgi:hypothetical protein